MKEDQNLKIYWELKKKQRKYIIIVSLSKSIMQFFIQRIIL